jgi:outer membrane protein
MKKQMIIALAAVAAMASGSAMAFEKGDWRTTIGMTNVQPDNPVLDDNAKVDDATQLSFTGAYFFTPALALELLASLPFQHDIWVAGVDGGVTTKQLPPTLSLQWHFNSGGTVVPYLGLGINYTKFFSTNGYGDLSDADVDLGTSTNVAVQAGLDYMFTDKLFMNVDLRYIKLESDVKVDGTKFGTAKINPTTVGVSLGYKF